jgi:hypothetical protein
MPTVRTTVSGPTIVAAREELSHLAFSPSIQAERVEKIVVERESSRRRRAPDVKSRVGFPSR